MTAAPPSAGLTGSLRAEAVTVLANMTMAALEGGGDERRGEDQQCAPRPPGGDLSSAVVDGPSPRAHRVHDTAVRPGRGGGRAGWARADVLVIDTDLGVSGRWGVVRAGFTGLVSRV